MTRRPPVINLPDQHHAALLPRRNGQPYLRIENAAEEVADVYIYDFIGQDMWGEGVGARDFGQMFRDITARNITVHLNSPGGDVFDGIAIYNAIRDHPSNVTVRVEGLAASAASFIAMAGDQVLMAPHSMMMIHDPWAIMIGNAADMRAEADLLDSMSNNIASIYAEHASGPRGGTRGDTKAWRERMLAETWYTDEEAVSAGLADGIDRAASAVKNTFDLSRFRNTPAHLLAAEPETDQPLTVRDAEQALRDAGYSRREAMAILSEGYGALTLRDAEEPPETEVTETEAAEYPRELARARLRLRELSLSA